MKINIIRQDALKFQRLQRIKRINLSVTFGVFTCFLLLIVWMTGRFIYLNLKADSLTKSVRIQQEVYIARGNEAVEYSVIKQIVSAVSEIQGSRFRYKDFLNEIYKLLPVGVRLSSVDFGHIGVIVASIRLASLTDYDTLLANVNRAGGSDLLFSAISQTQFQRDETGQYLVTLELKIK